MSDPYTTFPDRQLSPVPILGNEKSGWATALRLDGGRIAPSLGRWTRENQEVQLTPLAWSHDFPLDSGFQGFVDGRYILGGNRSTSPILIGEFDATSGQLIEQFEFSENAGTVRACVALGNGGLCAIAEVDGGGRPVFIFDVCYREPAIAAYSSPKWWFQRFEFPANLGVDPIVLNMTGVQAADGLVTFFFTHDSGGTVGRIRFRIGLFGLELVDYNEQWIGRHRPETPSGELPEITAMWDRYNNRTVLAYQPWEDKYPDCPGLQGEPASRWMLTAAQGDQMSVLGVADWWSLHVSARRPVVFPRPDGIYFAFSYCNIDTDCAQGWNLGRFSDGRFEVLAQLPKGIITSYSNDGWILFYDFSTFSTDLIRLRLAPQMSVSKTYGGLRIDWDQAAPTDRLLAGSSPSSIGEVAHTGLPPAVVAYVDRPAQFFRVQTH